MGDWRIVDVRGGGTFGVVYLVEGNSGRAALKLALRPRDVRFEREVALLSRIRHPAVPRFIAHGEWQSPAGQPHPYLVMEWVEGLPLYEWARVRGPTSRQVLRLLANIARALEATHAAKAVHRDVKGDNMLVRLKDGQAFLTDFGSGSYAGATPVTAPVFPPGTREYRSPEAIAFAVNILQSPIKVYAHRPTDDVFALGVTAYRLVTGEYPPTADPLDEGVHVWQAGGTGPQPAQELNDRCSPELSAFIARMLSLRPEARGSARELASALEKAARKVGPEADTPLFPGAQPAPGNAEAAPRRFAFRVPHQDGWPWLPTAALAGAMALVAAWMLGMPEREEAQHASVSVQEETRDAGTVAAGDMALTAPVASIQEPSAWSSIALELPSKPLQGQVRPDARGRCPSRHQVPINGGCWKETKEPPTECDDFSYRYKGSCYMPVFHPLRPPPSTPAEPRDGGLE